MTDLTENLTIRCSPADLEIIERLRANRSRGALVCALLRRAERGDASTARTDREKGIVEETAGLAVRRGRWQVEEETE